MGRSILFGCSPGPHPEAKQTVLTVASPPVWSGSLCPEIASPVVPGERAATQIGPGITSFGGLEYRRPGVQDGQYVFGGLEYRTGNTSTSIGGRTATGIRRATKIPAVSKAGRTRERSLACPSMSLAQRPLRRDGAVGSSGAASGLWNFTWKNHVSPDSR